LFGSKLGTAALFLSTLLASCDSSSDRQGLRESNSIRPVETDAHMGAQEQVRSASDAAPLFSEAEFISVARRYADSELRMRGHDYDCEVVLVNEVEVRVSLRTGPMPEQPGGWGERIIIIDRKAMTVKEVLHSQ